MDTGVGVGSAGTEAICPSSPPDAARLEQGLVIGPGCGPGFARLGAGWDGACGALTVGRRVPNGLGTVPAAPGTAASRKGRLAFPAPYVGTLLLVTRCHFVQREVSLQSNRGSSGRRRGTARAQTCS